MISASASLNVSTNVAPFAATFVVAAPKLTVGAVISLVELLVIDVALKLATCVASE